MEREARIARLEAEAREDRLRFAARGYNERPLRDSRSRGASMSDRPRYDKVH